MPWPSITCANGCWMTPTNDPNLDGLERVAVDLGELVDELVLVGGTAAGLLITDPGAEPVRPTMDVDVIVEAYTLAQLAQFHRRLRERGFHEGDHDGDPICRWRKGDLILDLLPEDESVLGFTNRWYRAAFDRALESTLPSGVTIRHVDGPHFVATKLEAYADRGGRDPATSHDIEDIVRVFDGRPELPREIVAADLALRTFIAEELLPVLEDRFFREALSTYFTADGDRRARIVFERMRGVSV